MSKSKNKLLHTAPLKLWKRIVVPRRNSIADVILRFKLYYVTFSSRTSNKTSHSQQRNNLQLYQQMTCLSIYSSAKLAN